MSYIGNQAENKVSPAFMRETLTPDGSATYFDLIHDVPGYNAETLLVTVNNVIQEPANAYTILNDANLRPRRLNFGVALASTDTLYVVHRGSGELYHTPPSNSVGTSALQDNLRSGNVDSFTATAAQTAFTLSEIPYNAASIDVYVNGIYQKPDTNYTVTGSSTTLTLSSGVLVNDEVDVHHNTLRTTITQVPDGSITSAKLDTNIAIGGTLAVTGASTLTGNVTCAGNLTITGDWTVNGTTTTINSTTLTVDDKNIEMGSVASPTDTTADGGGITLKGTTDKTILWENDTDSWNFNQNIETSTTTKVKQKGEFMTHSLHRSWVMGG